MTDIRACRENRQILALACHLALRAWLDTSARNHAAYYAYRAALDRDEAAAVDLARLSRPVAA